MIPGKFNQHRHGDVIHSKCTGNWIGEGLAAVDRPRRQESATVAFEDTPAPEYLALKAMGYPRRMVIFCEIESKRHLFAGGNRLCCAAFQVAILDFSNQSQRAAIPLNCRSILFVFNDSINGPCPAEQGMATQQWSLCSNPSPGVVVVLVLLAESFSDSFAYLDKQHTEAVTDTCCIAL